MSIEPGFEIPPFEVAAVEAAHIKMFALILRDPNPIHFDLAAVAAAGLGTREVNQGGATLSYVLDMLVAWAGSRGAVKRLGCRFTANVFAGDRVTARGTVTAIEETAGRLLAECDIWVEGEDGGKALTGTASVLL
jgi:acyl dehydratase